MISNKFKTGTGFTLIELLVVIAIIGMLSAIVLSSLNSARLKARDVRRKADLHQIRLALELYYDSNNRYPVIAAWACSATNNLGGCSNASWNSLATALQPYITKLPNDPTNINVGDPSFDGNLTYAYYSNISGSVYDLIAILENTADTDRCANKGYVDYIFSNGGPPYYWCAPFAPTVPTARSGQIYSDH